MKKNYELYDETLQYEGDFMGYEVYRISGARRKKGSKVFACCSIPEQIIILFSEFDVLSDDSKTFLLLHEIGHLKYRTGSETIANEYAIKMHKKGMDAFVKATEETALHLSTVKQSLRAA